MKTGLPIAAVPLNDDECRHLLSAGAFGRLAFDTGDGPMILPVNYVFVEPNIVIRTAPGSKLHDSPLTLVAFEIDEVGEDHTSGWSVVARGMAFDISTAVDEQSEFLRSLPFATWAGGEKSHWVKINVRELTGRRFGTPGAKL